MAYFNLEETKRRVEKVKGILREKNLDCAIIYYDELNVADGWYLTGWCPQFEKEAVMVFANEADPILLGGPESAPFAKYDYRELLLQALYGSRGGVSERNHHRF